MSSQRLTGKVLRPIAGKPMLQYLLERLDRCHALDLTLVATSVEAEDDPVAALAADLGIGCHRGPLDDVAGRFLATVNQFELDAFVRLSGDSPLMDPAIVDRGVQVFLDGEWDLATNVMPRTYPPGQSVEVIGSEPFRRAYQRMTQQDELEHVSRHFYLRPDEYRIVNFTSGRAFPGVHLAIDTLEQLREFEAVVGRMDRPHVDYGLEDIMRIHGELFSGAVQAETQ